MKTHPFLTRSIPASAALSSLAAWNNPAPAPAPAPDDEPDSTGPHQGPAGT